MLGFLCDWGEQGLRLMRQQLRACLEHAVDVKTGYMEMLLIILWYETLINIAAIRNNREVSLKYSVRDIKDVVQCENVTQNWLKGMNTLRNKFVHMFFMFDFTKLVRHIQSIGEISFLRLCQYVFAEYYDEELCSEFYKDLGVKAAISSEVFVEAVEIVKGSNDNKRLLSI